MNESLQLSLASQYHLFNIISIVAGLWVREVRIFSQPYNEPPLVHHDRYTTREDILHL